MKKTDVISAKELRRRDFEAARRDIESRVDSAISCLNAGVPQAGVTAY